MVNMDYFSKIMSRHTQLKKTPAKKTRKCDSNLIFSAKLCLHARIVKTSELHEIDHFVRRDAKSIEQS